MSCLTGPLKAVGVPLEQFVALTRIPIVLFFGDNIPGCRLPYQGRTIGVFDSRWRGCGATP